MKVVVSLATNDEHGIDGGGAKPEAEEQTILILQSEI